MSATNVATRIESAAGPERLIDAAPGFAACYSDRSFSFVHSLAHHPAFEIPRLARLAGRLAAQRKLVFQAANVAVSETWDTVERRPFETVGPGVELGIREDALPERESGGVGREGRHLLEEPVDGAVAGVGSRATAGKGAP